MCKWGERACFLGGFRFNIKTDGAKNKAGGSADDPARAGVATRIVLRVEEGDRDAERHARVREEPVPDVNADVGEGAPFDIEKHQIPEHQLFTGDRLAGSLRPARPLPGLSRPPSPSQRRALWPA